ncbi:hypothetical protein P7C73_g5694, partial [Tremellales sp. Uapishka_1]
MPDPQEMDDAFDGPDQDEGENDGLLGRDWREGGEEIKRIGDGDGHVPGEYDFDRNYFLPPSSSPPPFQPYSSHNPAPGNTNGLLPQSPAVRPSPQARHFLGGILPSSFLPRQTPNTRLVGGGATSGVFANLAARPEGPNSLAGGGDVGPDYVAEDEQKDGPPSYAAALRDAVPPYWDTTVVLPSSQSPFGPLSSSMSGDEILIDGMPVGNVFGFCWNLVVSVSFQFIGFLLTYVLHTTHSAKYGSRVGLGITLIQFGLTLRSKAETLIETGQFETVDPSEPLPAGSSPADAAAENTIDTFAPAGFHWPIMNWRPPNADPTFKPIDFQDAHEIEAWAEDHNKTISWMLDLPSAEEVGRANEWFSFILMCIGWFLVLTSVGGWWRVKRYEKALKRAQRESEEAQAAANSNGDEAINTVSTRPTAGPNSLEYYTSAFTQAFNGAREIQRGFFGMRGRPQRGDGHAPLSEDENEHELLDAQGFGLEPMATSESEPGSRRGLWG